MTIKFDSIAIIVEVILMGFVKNQLDTRNDIYIFLFIFNKSNHDKIYLYKMSFVQKSSHNSLKMRYFCEQNISCINFNFLALFRVSYKSQPLFGFNTKKNSLLNRTTFLQSLFLLGCNRK